MGEIFTNYCNQSYMNLSLFRIDLIEFELESELTRV